MREFRSYGSVGEAPGNRCFYPEGLDKIKFSKVYYVLLEIKNIKHLFCYGVVYDSSPPMLDLKRWINYYNPDFPQRIYIRKGDDARVIQEK